MINPFKRKKKLSDFEGKGLSPATEKEGIEQEYKHALITKILLFVVIILGVVLCILDIQDKGMLIELSFGGNNIKYTGSLIGVIVILPCIIGIIKTNGKVKLEH